MIDYSKIKNEKLRQLVLLSESIQSQSEEAIQVMVERVAELPEEGEDLMIASLEDEQNQIRAIKNAKEITPEMEIEQLNQNNQKILAAKRHLEKVVRSENEKNERTQVNGVADDLRKAAGSRMRLKFHLPKAVMRGDISLGKVEIMVVLRKNMGDVKAVVPNHDFVLKSFQRERGFQVKVFTFHVLPNPMKWIKHPSKSQPHVYPVEKPTKSHRDDQTKNCNNVPHLFF